MNLRLLGFGALGLAVLSGIHGCASDDDTTKNPASGAESGAGGAKGSAGHGASGGMKASGGTSTSGGTNDAGSPSTGGSAADGGTGASGKSSDGGTGGTRSGSGGGHVGSGGSTMASGGSNNGTGGNENGTGGSGLEGGASGEAGAAAGGAPTGGTAGSSGAGAGGTAGSSGTAGSGGIAGSNGGMAGSSGGSSAGQAGSAGTGGCTDSLNLPLLSSAPATLDLTGLYTSADALPTDTASYVQEYTPTYPLWSDGATKKRWIYLPPCTQIDTSDMDHWVFPVGTRFWKEFRIGTTLVETRFIHRFGTGANDWLFAAYQWDPAVSSPTAGNTIYVPHGVGNANGTPHDIPDQSDCTLCHGHLPEHILGFGAFELTGSPGAIDIGVLSQQNLLTDPAPDGYTPPGTSVQQAGLGYLHANCGICHSAYFDATATDPPRMRLTTTQYTVETTDTYKTLVKHLTQNPDFNGVYRIDPSDHANSEIYQRMSLRPSNSTTYGYDQMPPVATEVPDTDGMAAVAAFIDSLPADAPAGQ